MAVDKRAVRLGALALVSVVLLSVVGARLWFLQTVQRSSLQARVQLGKTRTQYLVPERGRIFDAQGRILADNRRVLTVTVDRAVIRRLSQRTELFTRLSGLLDTPVEEMERRYNSSQYSQFLPLPLKEDVAEDVVLQIESRSEDYPGVSGDEDYARVYPYAPLASHVIGFLGLILKNQAADYKAQDYLPNESVGQFGVEKSMESVLHGTRGQVVYEVDSANRIVREISRVDPVPGKDVQLTIDLTVQQYTERILATELQAKRTETNVLNMAKNTKFKDPKDGVIKYKFVNENWQYDADGNQYLPYPAPAGSIVIENYLTGQIAAMASYPNFDNRWFTVGLGDKFKILFPETKDPDKSILVNRAIQGQYNLGSTFKPFVAYSGLTAGVITPTSIFQDDGSWKLESVDKAVCDTGVRCEYFNATSSGTGKPSKYGPIMLEDALAVSSDAYFYAVGEKMWEKNKTLLGQDVALFGFGSKTGIDLPYEFTGRIPSTELKQQLIASHVLGKSEAPRMLVGDNVQLAIGQGLLAASPLQLANAYSTLADGGYLDRPLIIKAIYQGGVPDGYPGYADLPNGNLLQSFDQAEVIHQIPLTPSIANPIVKGLTRVIAGPGVDYPSTVHHYTTGELLFRNYPYPSLPIAGKTGTAQGSQSKPWFDSSVFASFSLDPTRPYTVVSYLEKAGYGAKASGPVVKCVMELLGGQIVKDPVTMSDPLNTAVLTPAQAYPDLNNVDCLSSPFDGLKD